MHQQAGHKSVTEFIKPLGLEGSFIVHRLDTETSGLLLIAKHKRAAAEFGTLFEQRKIAKLYLALSDQKPKKKQGHILGDMQPSRSGNYKLVPTKSNPAYTQFFSQSLAYEQKPLRLFLLKPHTGKTHQLRVAMKSIGSPILGDTRYGKTQSDRMYLHAYELVFEWYGEMIRIKALPDTGQYCQSNAYKDAVESLTQRAISEWPAPIWQYRV